MGTELSLLPLSDLVLIIFIIPLECNFVSLKIWEIAASPLKGSSNLLPILVGFVSFAIWVHTERSRLALKFLRLPKSAVLASENQS